MFKNSLPIIAFLLFLTCLVRAQDDKELHIERFENNPHTNVSNEFLRLKAALPAQLLEKNKLNAAITLQQLGSLCYHLGHFDQSFEYYLQADKLFENLKAYKHVAYNANEMGILFYYNKDMKNAREQYEKAIGIFKKLGDQQGIAETYGRIGHLFEKQQQYDSALYYQNTALQHYRSVDDKSGLAKIYENLGSIDEDLEKYNAALNFFRMANDLYVAAGNQLGRIEVVNNIGDIHRKTGDFKTGLQYSREALQLSQLYKDRYQMCSAYRDIGKAYNLMHLNDSAFYYLELSRKILLEIYSEESNNQIAFLQVQYDINKKDKEIGKLQLEKRINIIITVSVVIVIVLFVVLGIAIISRQRLKIKNEQFVHDREREMLETQNKLNEAELKAKTLEEEKLKTEILNRQLEREKLFAEIKNRDLEEETLKQLIDTKTKELSTHTLHIIQKNHLLENLKGRLEAIAKEDKRDQKKPIREIIQQINQNFNNDKYWEEFSNTFEQIHFSFFSNLKQHASDLTASEIRLVSLLKMNLNSNDMATILGISLDSLRVARYRLRKKLNLDQGENLSSFLQALN
jgi:tetratricopeptide (TPR) repeat protein